MALDLDDRHGVSRRKILECMTWAGTGVLWTIAGGMPRSMGIIGEATAAEPSGLTFLQISDSHVGFDKPANPNAIGTLEEAVNKINALPVKPSFIIHTGDITHLSKVSEFDDAERIISQARLDVHYVPGEHDVLDEDVKLYRNRYGRGTNGAGWYSFDANGVHFIGLVNVVDLKAGGLGNLGNEQLEWLEDDLKSRTSSTPVVVFAHIPLWSVYPAWGWGTEDAARALDYLKRFGSVTVLNGHIHQIMQKVEGNVTFHTAMSKWQQIGCCGQLLRAQTVRLWIRVIRRCDRPLDHGDRETARLKLAIVTEPTADYPTVAYTLDGQHRPART